MPFAASLGGGSWERKRTMYGERETFCQDGKNSRKAASRATDGNGGAPAIGLFTLLYALLLYCLA